LSRQNLPKLSGPKKLPIEITRYLTRILGHSPNWVQGLMYAEQPKAGIKNICDVRVFDELITTGNKVYVKNFISLDDFPDLILFKGWLNKDDGTAILE
jgi:hypothetical protein